MSAPYYQDDLVTLYHGNCLEITEWLAADVLVTDPPYGVDWKAGDLAANKTMRQRAVSSIKGDRSLDLRNSALKTWGERPAIVFGVWYKPRPENVRHRLIWYKEKTYAGVRTHPWFAADEEIYVLGSGFAGPPTSNMYVTKRMMAANHGLVAEVGHPTPKPVGLMEQLIDKCPPGVIADPFAGSGSTLIAARNLGRKAIGVEIEERYCEMTVKRLSQQAFDFGEVS